MEMIRERKSEKENTLKQIESVERNFPQNLFMLQKNQSSI